jgi:hypothetical protein
MVLTTIFERLERLASGTAEQKTGFFRKKTKNFLKPTPEVSIRVL